MTEQHDATDKTQRRRPCETAAEWNLQYAVGTEVRFMPVSEIAEYEYSQTRSEAWAMGDRPVVMIEGRSGGVALDHLTVTSWQFWLDKNDGAYLLVRSPAVRTDLFDAVTCDGDDYQMDFVSVGYLIGDCERVEETRVASLALAAILAVKAAA